MRTNTKLQDFVTVLPEPVIPLVAFPVGVIHQIIETQTVDHLCTPLHSPVGRAANWPRKRARSTWRADPQPVRYVTFTPNRYPSERQSSSRSGGLERIGGPKLRGGDHGDNFKIDQVPPPVHPGGERFRLPRFHDLKAA